MATSSTILAALLLTIAALVAETNAVACPVSGGSSVDCLLACCSSLASSTFTACCSSVANTALNTAAQGLSTVIIIVIVVSVVVFLGIIACIVCCVCGVCAACSKSGAKTGAVVAPAQPTVVAHNPNPPHSVP